MFPLHPDTPQEGLPLEELFRSTPERVAAMVEGLRRTAVALGLPFGPRTTTCNTRLAQEIGLWAEDQGKGEQFHHAAFRAYFGTGSNLARREILLDIVHHIGLPVSQAGDVLADRTYSSRVDQDWQDARSLGITAVPTFLAGPERLVGAVDYTTLVTLVTS